MSAHITLCPYCDRRFEDDEKSNARRTRDHVIPQAMGGNIVVHACWQCNNDKGQYLPREWLAKLRLSGDPRARHVERFMAEACVPVEPFKLDKDPYVNTVCDYIARALYGTDRLTEKQWHKALETSSLMVDALRNDGLLPRPAARAKEDAA